MKRIIFMIFLCAYVVSMQAQKITRHYQNESLSKVLEDLNTAYGDQTIYFIYDELEDFTVTSRFSNLFHQGGSSRGDRLLSHQGDLR